MGSATTIKVHTDTRDSLQALEGNRTYDQFLQMLLRLVPEGDGEGKFTPELRMTLLEGLLYEGPRISHEDLKREFGLP